MSADHRQKEAPGTGVGRGFWCLRPCGEGGNLATPALTRRCPTPSRDRRDRRRAQIPAGAPQPQPISTTPSPPLGAAKASKAGWTSPDRCWLRLRGARASSLRRPLSFFGDLIGACYDGIGEPFVIHHLFLALAGHQAKFLWCHALLKFSKSAFAVWSHRLIVGDA